MAEVVSPQAAAGAEDAGVVGVVANANAVADTNAGVSAKVAVDATASDTATGASTGSAENVEVAESKKRVFSVNLNVYSGPFDALLSMIADRRLELTEVSLAAITGEFIDYVRGLDMARDMDEISAFLDVASVLIEAKSASLLPGDENGERDEQSMEALRERDLLFARLVQYRAFKRAADDFRARLAENSGRFPHPAFADEAIAAMLPELAWTLGPQELAKIAAEVFLNAPADQVSLHQLHVSQVDLKEQSRIVRQRLRGLEPGSSMTFAELVADTSSKLEVVARFLAILLFFKQGVVQYKQSGPFEDLNLRWMPGDGAGDDGADDDDDMVEISEGDFA